MMTYVDKLSRYLLCLLVLVLSSSFLSSPVRAQGVGTIEGQVTLAGEESLPEGLEAELLFLPNGQGPPVITAQPLEEGGIFRFTDLDT
ncbi:MAG: hypothetical protein M3220_05560, partial [Chloroflexota bacterium]|nr:hypothetical protein [Chloroflexota bacterium]